MKNIWFILAILMLISCAKQPSLPVLVDEAGFITEHNGKTV